MRRKACVPTDAIGTGAAKREDLVHGRDCSYSTFDGRRFGKPNCRGARAVLPRSRQWMFSIVLAGLAALSCGTPATFQITAPPSTVAGLPFTITVTAMVGRRRDTVINSPVHFTSSDSAAILPADYYFTASDAGSHTFTNGVTLMTPGNQSIRGTDPGAPGLTGSVNLSVMIQAGVSRSR